MSSVRIALGIGSNLNRRRHIENALRALREEFGELQISPVYRSFAVGFEGPDFFNLVCLAETNLEVPALRDVLKKIEGREGRSYYSSRFSSRTLDIDILLYGDCVLTDLGFDIPRHEILEHAFVLKPMADMLPNVTHPQVGKNFSTLWSEFGKQEAQTIQPVAWSPG